MKKMTLMAILIFAALSAAVPAHHTAEHLNKQGLDEFNKQSYEAAVRYFERAISMKADYASAYYNLGTAYFYLRRFAPSFDALREAIKLNPASAASHNQLGVVYLESGDGTLAVAAFKEAIRLRPDNASALYNLGCAYIRSKDFGAAAELLERARRLDPSNAEIRLNLAYALSREKRLPEAIAEMETAVNLNPADAELQLFLGNLFILKYERARAADQYAKLKRLDTARARQLYEAIHRGQVITVSGKNTADK
jgi:tetratricopeptide (TPR) repeat protein